MTDDEPDLPEEPPIKIGDLVIPTIKYAYAFTTVDGGECYLPHIPLLVVNDSDMWEGQATVGYDGKSTKEWVMLMVPERGVVCTRRVTLRVVS